MALMTTVLEEFADNGNSRTFALPLHTAAKPALVIQKRKVPTGNQKMIETTITLVSGTEDASAVPMDERITTTISTRKPIGCAQADVDAQMAIGREIHASDNFTDAEAKQTWLQNT